MLRFSDEIMRPINKILIPHRSESALRILRTCHDHGIRTVIGHSTEDEGSMPVLLSDETVCIGRAPIAESYRNKANILSAAHITHVDAVHPGIGFLSEDAEFAQMVERDHGFIFIGPSPEHILSMGDKLKAKEKAATLGLPIIPGSQEPLRTLDAAIRCAKAMGYPILMKAVHGGGGKGMRVIRSSEQLQELFSLMAKEAEISFGNGDLYLERYLEHPRHIEVQILGDMYGNVLHLGERDCSVQRRHQKLWEETPALGLTQTLREKLLNCSKKAISVMGYCGVGTLEFLIEGDEFFFMEMNTRLQVEHTITEMVTGIDLVWAQIQVAQGRRLLTHQDEINLTGHSIQCRINAEDPETFAPSPGYITAYVPPGGLGVRIDSALFSGAHVSPYYDSLVAKLVIHADDRALCLGKLRRALREYVIMGTSTLIPLHRKIADDPAIIQGAVSTKWLEQSFLKTSEF